MNTEQIFEVKTEFDFVRLSLEVFHYQYENIEIYRKFVDLLKLEVNSIKSISQIPFLPIEIFKNHQILDSNKKTEIFFQSSGTSDIILRSKHYIADPAIYEQSILKSFKKFIGNPQQFVFLALLPNYSENQNSSLIYMVDYLMKLSNDHRNGYFLYNHEELYQKLSNIKDKKVILFGVSFALLDFADFLKGNNLQKLPENITAIETGGMKGRKKEITKDQLYLQLQNGLGTKKIYSEYSMTELLSQSYAIEGNIYRSPNWMRIICRSTEDPFSYVPNGRTGAINIIDLANIHSCSFIATQDLGRILTTDSIRFFDQKFEIIGRIDHSDIRGCSMLVS